MWNLLNKGEEYEIMAQHLFVCAVFEKILGDDFIMGSIATNTLLPGATGMVWYGMVWYGMVWYGMVWYGMVW